MAVRLRTRRAAATLALAALALSPSALAGGDGQRGSETFEGTCQFSGTLRQDPPLTNLPQAGEASASARGACSGTLTSERGKARRLDGAQASYFARAAGTTSCGGGTAEGSGFLVIRGERIGFRFSELRGPGTGAIRLDGTGGGSAAGVATVSQDEDPVAIAQKCSGPGLERVGIDITIGTTPAISG
jgi:hypothetical protein